MLADGAGLNACTMLTVQADGGEITTIAVHGSAGELSPVHEAFGAEHGPQCGLCTPAFVLSSVALLDVEVDPDEEMIERTLEGNLCRCTGYTNIVRAVRYAAASMRGETPEATAGRAHEVAIVRNPTAAVKTREKLGKTEVVQ